MQREWAVCLNSESPNLGGWKARKAIVAIAERMKEQFLRGQFIFVMLSIR